MSEWQKTKAQLLISQAISKLVLAINQPILIQAMAKEFADGMNQLAYATGLISDAEFDDYQAHIVAIGKRNGLLPTAPSDSGDAQLICPVDTSAWPPCNPACDPDLNGQKSRHCICEQAKAALAAQGVIRA